MFSPVLSRFSKPNSCLLLLFFFSYFHYFSCAKSQREDMVCDPLFKCGNITAGFPFWGVVRPQPCGHPSLGLHCYKNSTSLIISSIMYRVLEINMTTSTLKLVRQDFLGPFCAASFSGATLTPELFQLLPNYKTLSAYFLCRRRFHYPANFTCRNAGVGSMHQNDSYHEICGGNFNITVPINYAPEEKALNVAKLESVLKKGFEVKLRIDERPCQKCKSASGICGYDGETPVCCKIDSSLELKCTPMIPSKTSVEERHMRCANSFSCANERALYYPFWEPGREECGHPDFKVNCSGEFAEFSISSVRFRILEMNFPIIKLSRIDYLNNLCSQYPVNTSIIQEVLPLHGDTELLTFYYNCSGSRVDVPSNDYTRKLHCVDDTGGKKYLVSSPPHSRDRVILDEFNASCKNKFRIPVSQDALKRTVRNQILEAMKEALDEGFTLKVNRECWECLESKGTCGYNKSSEEFICYYINEPHRHTCDQKGSEKKGLSERAKLGIGFACGLLGATLTIGGLLCFMRRRKKLAAQYTSKGISETTSYSSENMLSITPTSTTISARNHCFLTRKRESLHHPRHHNLEAFVQLKQYSYEEVKKITKSFSHTVGKGGFGTVYGGKLCDGRKVAVKILKDFKNSGEDFINEVASMSQTSHVNIVSLLGFCYEGSKRAIVYEFLKNGSLDEFISSKKSLNLNVGTLYGVALGVARGLEYLHHGCKTRIVHFDIKPQNILLDDNLCPKVSDFGLARLCEKRESILSLLEARGTIGYIAPEVFSRMYGRVSHKSDVYSYGMLIFEMVGERNKEPTASNLSSAYFPDWIYNHLENGDYMLKYGNEIRGEEKEIAKKMILVGLWCIQPCPSNRPPMNKVVKMMEGSLDALEVPPKSSFHFSSMALPEYSSLSEDNSNHTDVFL